MYVTQGHTASKRWIQIQIQELWLQSPSPNLDATN
jgi:hypothetical protein